MSITRVVNVRHKHQFDVYIGRYNRHYKLPKSKWHNPFKVGVHGDIHQVMHKYHEYLYNSPHLLAALPQLRGKALGCWCKDFVGDDTTPCHGDILVNALYDLHGDDIAWQSEGGHGLYFDMAAEFDGLSAWMRLTEDRILWRVQREKKILRMGNSPTLDNAKSAIRTWIIQHG